MHTQQIHCRCISWMYYFICAQGNMYKDVIAGGNNKKLKTTQMSMNRRIDKQTVVYSGILDNN